MAFTSMTWSQSMRDFSHTLMASFMRLMTTEIALERKTTAQDSTAVELSFDCQQKVR